MKRNTISTSALVVIFAVFIASIGAWATHVITCIQNQEWAFLIAGALMMPIGIVHGIGIWFGVWI